MKPGPTISKFGIGRRPEYIGRAPSADPSVPNGLLSGADLRGAQGMANIPPGIFARASNPLALDALADIQIRQENRHPPKDWADLWTAADSTDTSGSGDPLVETWSQRISEPRRIYLRYEGAEAQRMLQRIYPADVQRIRSGSSGYRTWRTYQRICHPLADSKERIYTRSRIR